MANLTAPAKPDLLDLMDDVDACKQRLKDAYTAHVAAYNTAVELDVNNSLKWGLMRTLEPWELTARENDERALREAHNNVWRAGNEVEAAETDLAVAIYRLNKEAKSIYKRRNQ